jgi:hypothetical protein
LRTPEILAVFPWANTTVSNQKHLNGKLHLKKRIINTRATLAKESSSGNLLSNRIFFVQISYLKTRIVSIYQHFEGYLPPVLCKSCIGPVVAIVGNDRMPVSPDRGQSNIERAR